MVIFVTDEGSIWNHENPILERYADCVVVVCLNGKAVTDKYRCIVSPYQVVGLGMTEYGTESYKFKALMSVKRELRLCFSNHEDIVLLTDNAPASLYSYFILKDMCEKNRLHLWCISPLKFETKKRYDFYYKLLQNTDALTSLLFLDANEFLKTIDRRATLVQFYIYIRDYLSELLPAALYEMDTMMKCDEKYFYDFTVHRYINTQKLYRDLLDIESINENDLKDFIPKPMQSTLESLKLQSYPNDDATTKKIVEQLHPRYDGRAICDKLKAMRKLLANENGIPFETVHCPSTGSCAGTCEQCDKELSYLMFELEKIPKEHRKYPKQLVDREISIDLKQEPNRMLGVLRIDTKDELNRLKIPEFLLKKGEDNVE